MNISDVELLRLIIAADDRALRAGIEPRGRSLQVVPEVMSQLGSTWVAGNVNYISPLQERVSRLFRSLYRVSDLGVGGIHGGIFMFRDVFVRITIPIIFGRVGIDPLDHTDLSENQRRWLMNHPVEYPVFVDQWIDIFDLAAAVVPHYGFASPPDLCIPLLKNSCFHFQAAAATLSVAFDSRGAIQSSLLGAELALKAGLAALGHSESQRRKYGHDLRSAAEKLFSGFPNFDYARVSATIDRVPPLVENRYSNDQPTRIETGHIVMGCQYIAGEVARQLTSHTTRAQIANHLPRVYPAIDVEGP